MAEAKKVPLLIVHIPAHSLFPERPGTSAKVPRANNVFGGWLKAWAEKKSVAFVDLEGPLAAWYRESRNPPLYQSTHFHFNELGLRKAAEWVRPALEMLLTQRS